MKASRQATAGRSAARPAVPSRAVRTVRAQAMDNTPKEFRKAEAAPSLAGLPTLNTTPFDDWKFAPIREATVRDSACVADPCALTPAFCLTPHLPPPHRRSAAP